MKRAPYPRGNKAAQRDRLRAELTAKGLDMSTVDNIGVLKWQGS